MKDSQGQKPAIDPPQPEDEDPGYINPIAADRTQEQDTQSIAGDKIQQEKENEVPMQQNYKQQTDQQLQNTHGSASSRGKDKVKSGESRFRKSASTNSNHKTKSQEVDKKNEQNKSKTTVVKGIQNLSFSKKAKENLKEAMHKSQLDYQLSGLANQHIMVQNGEQKQGGGIGGLETSRSDKASIYSQGRREIDVRKNQSSRLAEKTRDDESDISQNDRQSVNQQRTVKDQITQKIMEDQLSQTRIVNKKADSLASPRSQRTSVVGDRESDIVQQRAPLAHQRNSQNEEKVFINDIQRQGASSKLKSHAGAKSNASHIQTGSESNEDYYQTTQSAQWTIDALNESQELKSLIDLGFKREEVLAALEATRQKHVLDALTWLVSNTQTGQQFNDASNHSSHDLKGYRSKSMSFKNINSQKGQQEPQTSNNIMNSNQLGTSNTLNSKQIAQAKLAKMMESGQGNTSVFLNSSKNLSKGQIDKTHTDSQFDTYNLNSTKMNMQPSSSEDIRNTYLQHQRNQFFREQIKLMEVRLQALEQMNLEQLQQSQKVIESQGTLQKLPQKDVPKQPKIQDQLYYNSSRPSQDSQSTHQDFNPVPETPSTRARGHRKAESSSNAPSQSNVSSVINQEKNVSSMNPPKFGASRGNSTPNEEIRSIQSELDSRKHKIRSGRLSGLRESSPSQDFEYDDFEFNGDSKLTFDLKFNNPNMEQQFGQIINEQYDSQVGKRKGQTKGGDSKIAMLKQVVEGNNMRNSIQSSNESVGNNEEASHMELYSQYLKQKQHLRRLEQQFISIQDQRKVESQQMDSKETKDKDKKGGNIHSRNNMLLLSRVEEEQYRSENKIQQLSEELIQSAKSLQRSQQLIKEEINNLRNEEGRRSSQRSRSRQFSDRQFSERRMNDSRLENRIDENESEQNISNTIRNSSQQLNMTPAPQKDFTITEHPELQNDKEEDKKYNAQDVHFSSERQLNNLQSSQLMQLKQQQRAILGSLNNLKMIESEFKSAYKGTSTQVPNLIQSIIKSQNLSFKMNQYEKYDSFNLYSQQQNF